MKIGDWCVCNGTRELICNLDEDWAICINAEGFSSRVLISGVTHLPECTGWGWSPGYVIPEGWFKLDDAAIMQKGDARFDGIDDKPRRPLGAYGDHGGITVAEFRKKYAHRDILAVIRKLPPVVEYVVPEGWYELDDTAVMQKGDARFDGIDDKPRRPLGAYGDHGGITVANFRRKYGNLNILAVIRRLPPVARPFTSAVEFAPHADKWVSWMDGTLGRVLSFDDRQVRVSGLRVFEFGEAFEQLKFAEFKDGEIKFTKFGITE